MEMAYKTVGIPKIISDRFDKIRRYYGYRSFSEFVVEVVRDAVAALETRHELIDLKEQRKDEHEL